MAKLYLITGFLGAGKTTFLQELVRLFPGQKIALIINEFGKTGVDGTLLQTLGIALTEINNGSIFCSCQIGQFEEALRAVADQAPDLVFVEASGLSDPTAIRGILAQPQVGRELEYAGAVCLVDGVRFQKVYQTARVCRMQLAVSDLVLINKADQATREQLDAIRAVVQAQRPGRPVYETTFGRVEAAWLEAMACPAEGAPDLQIHTRDITLQKLTLEVGGFDLTTLTAFLRMFAEDTYRIKGFADLPEGRYFVDCVGPLVALHPFSGRVREPGRLVVLFGNGLPARKSIKAACAWYPDCTVTMA